MNRNEERKLLESITPDDILANPELGNAILQLKTIEDRLSHYHRPRESRPIFRLSKGNGEKKHRMFVVTTDKGHKYIVQCSDNSAKEIANTFMCTSVAIQGHDNPIMKECV